MRRLAAILVAPLLLAGTGAEGAQTDKASSNMKQLVEARLDWVRDALPDGSREMAFRGRLVVVGLADDGADNVPTAPEGGIAIYRILKDRPYLKKLSVLRCQSPGEISILGDTVILSGLRDHSREATGCNRNGLNLIDISDPRKPRLAKFIPLGCGVDVHTVIQDGDRSYALAPATCNEAVDHNPQNTGVLSEMAVVRVFPKRPEASYEAARPINENVGCAEVFVLHSRKLMGCLFFQSFTLFDISDPTNPAPIGGPYVLPAEDFAFYRGSFTWDGQYMVLGGGPSGVDFRCPDHADSMFFFNIEDLTNPVLVGRWAVPRRRDTNDCWTRGFNVLPMQDSDRYVAVAGFDSQGLSMIDFSDPTEPREIAFNVPEFSPHKSSLSDPDPYLSARIWAAYWHNGKAFATAQGEDVPRLRMFEVEGLGPRSVRYFRGAYNPQNQIESFR